MNLERTEISQAKDFKPSRSAQDHVMKKLDGLNSIKIHSVFLNRRSLGSKINWQTELLKLEDAS